MKIARIWTLSLGMFAGTSAFVVSHQPKERKINVVFDLDQTLFFTSRIKHKDLKHLRWKFPDFDFFLNNTQERYIGWHRPFVFFTLKTLSYFNNLHFFTAATPEYAKTIFSNTFLGRIPFQERLYRDSCQKTGKDLTKLTNGKLDSTILVDDRLENRVGRQHFYHITPYRGPQHTPRDYELLKFLVYMTWKNLVGL